MSRNCGIGEASDFYETIRKTAELHPDLIILDVNMPDRNRIAPSDVRSLLNGAKVLAITLGADDVADELLDSVGAVKVLDKMGSPTNSFRRFWNWHRRGRRSRISYPILNAA